MCKGYHISRTILLIKKGIAYKRRKDLENEYIASVWVQIIISKKNFNFNFIILQTVEPSTGAKIRRYELATKPKGQIFNFY